MKTEKEMLRSIITFFVGFYIACSPAFANGIFNATCQYSHTLPDDSIVHFDQPGQAMVHDFFGNTKTNASSDYDRLETNKVTTCNATADVSAYWVPQLKRGGSIVVPDLEKTYCMNRQPVVPLQAIPAGLQMLAGDHMGSKPSPHILFFCQGRGYTTTAPSNCPVVTDSRGTYAQLDIQVHFPDCWDGVHIKPDFVNHIMNMAYRNSDGKCPAAFPVKIPELQLNVQYSLGLNPDLSDAQLSMDPMFTNEGWIPQWGSLYTAHGDFINAWKKDSMRYAIDKCSNANVECDNNIPTYYSVTTADVWTDASGTPITIGPTLRLGPGDTIFLQFPTPQDTAEYPWTQASLQTQGQNVTDTSAIMLNLYAANTVWNQTDRPPQPADCTTKSIGGIFMNNANQTRLNDITAYMKTTIAAGSAMTGVCIRNTTGKTVVFSSKDGAFAPALFLK